MQPSMKTGIYHVYILLQCGVISEMCALQAVNVMQGMLNV